MMVLFSTLIYIGFNWGYGKAQRDFIEEEETRKSKALWKELKEKEERRRRFREGALCRYAERQDLKDAGLLGKM
jgi:hypothetical protein